MNISPSQMNQPAFKGIVSVKLNGNYSKYPKSVYTAIKGVSEKVFKETPDSVEIKLSPQQIKENSNFGSMNYHYKNKGRERWGNIAFYLDAPIKKLKEHIINCLEMPKSDWIKK